MRRLEWGRYDGPILAHAKQPELHTPAERSYLGVGNCDSLIGGRSKIKRPDNERIFTCKRPRRRRSAKPNIYVIVLSFGFPDNRRIFERHLAE